MILIKHIVCRSWAEILLIKCTWWVTDKGIGGHGNQGSEVTLPISEAGALAGPDGTVCSLRFLRKAEKGVVLHTYPPEGLADITTCHGELHHVSAGWLATHGHPKCQQATYWYLIPNLELHVNCISYLIQFEYLITSDGQDEVSWTIFWFH